MCKVPQRHVTTPLLSTAPSFSLGLVVPGVRSPHALAVFACALRAWLGSCEHPQQSTHTEPLSSPSERHLHNEDMRPVDRDPCDRYAPIIYMLYAIPLLKLVAPLRKNDCGGCLGRLRGMVESEQRKTDSLDIP